MTSVRCLLMGSAAGLMAVSAAQAADLPVNAAPVEYVKVCSLYGAGFWYVPGTDTCMKIGSYIRANVAVNDGQGTTPLGTGGQIGAGRYDRTDTSMFNFAGRAVVTFDVRTQTEYGTLRTYMNIGTDQASQGTWPNAPVTPGATTTAEGAVTKDSAGNGIYNSRAFIQFAGFTIGRMRSFFDINAMGAYTYSTSRLSADSAPGGIFGVGYTAQFGGGVSLSFSVEDGGAVTGGRGRYVTDLSQYSFGSGALGAGQSLDNSGQTFFDPVMGLRIDQSWGYASITGAFHNDSGGYYNNATNSTNASLANTITQGHPADTWGYAGSAGFLLTDFMGMRGDTLGAQAAYGKGAAGYVTRATGTQFIRSGNNIGTSNLLDGVFADGTQIDLTKEWSAAAEYEHYWTPKLRTAVSGGYVSISYDQNAKELICAGAPGYSLGFQPGAPNTPLLGTKNNSLGNGIASKTNQPGGFINGWAPGSQCNPDTSWWQLGTRTAWSPHPDLDIGIDVMYTALNTANKGSTVNVGASSGALPPGLYTFVNQGVWSAIFRVQRNFIP
jgi:Porin subfamily